MLNGEGVLPAVILTASADSFRLWSVCLSVAYWRREHEFQKHLGF